MFNGALPSSPTSSPEDLQRARGRARLSVAVVNGKTRLRELYQDGCAKLRCPKSYGTNTFEAVLLNTAGGLTGSDRIETEIHAAPGSAVTIASQTCERIYRSLGTAAHVETNITIAKGARVEWLPQETILFDGGMVRRRLRVDMAEDATLLAVEPVVFGRVASGETLDHGLFRDSWRIVRNDRLTFADETRLEGALDALTKCPGVLGGAKALATVLLAAPEAEQFIEPARQLLNASPNIGGVSFVNDVLISRLIAPDSQQLRASLIPLITLLRSGRDMPRAWQI